MIQQEYKKVEITFKRYLMALKYISFCWFNDSTVTVRYMVLEIIQAEETKGIRFLSHTVYLSMIGKEMNSLKTCQKIKALKFVIFSFPNHFASFRVEWQK